MNTSENETKLTHKYNIFHMHTDVLEEKQNRTPVLIALAVRQNNVGKFLQAGLCSCIHHAQCSNVVGFAEVVRC